MAAVRKRQGEDARLEVRCGGETAALPGVIVYAICIGVELLHRPLGRARQSTAPCERAGSEVLPAGFFASLKKSYGKSKSWRLRSFVIYLAICIKRGCAVASVSALNKRRRRSRPQAWISGGDCETLGIHVVVTREMHKYRTST